MDFNVPGQHGRRVHHLANRFVEDGETQDKEDRDAGVGLGHVPHVPITTHLNMPTDGPESSLVRDQVDLSADHFFSDATNGAIADFPFET